MPTATDSPVNIDSSTVVSPVTIAPSTGNFSPGKTRNHSPGLTCSTGISIVSALSCLPIKRAIGGCKETSLAKAAEARLRAFPSRVRPNKIKPSNITGSSKKHSQPNWGKNKAKQLAK